ncbi:MAG: GNAT family N-acetyltransferase [Micrococcales bacterium]|nr:GNAT family N-acetyltransferase [Micrococcales bacterium]
MTAVHVRQAGPADVETILGLKRQLLVSFGAPDPLTYADWHGRASAALLDMLGRDTIRFVVAEIDGMPVGCVSAQLHLNIPGPTWPGVHGELADMFVEPAVRGRGVARALAEDVLGWCRERGCTKVKLHSTPMAVGAWERLGFHVAQPKPGDDRFAQMWLDF